MLLPRIGGDRGVEVRCYAISIRRIEIAARLQGLELVRRRPRALLVARHSVFDRSNRCSYELVTFTACNDKLARMLGGRDVEAGRRVRASWNVPGTRAVRGVARRRC